MRVQVSLFWNASGDSTRLFNLVKIAFEASKNNETTKKQAGYFRAFLSV